ncbi:SDR family NAD(P)-dependent oxidoreductase [Paraburkholderia sp. RL18-101-BIB-B]
MNRDLEGKTIIVTGGGSGIGRAAALACSMAGARVVVADIDVAAGEETISAIRRAVTQSSRPRTWPMKNKSKHSWLRH